ARAAPIALQRDLEVILVLPAELRHVERRVHVAVARNRMAAGTGRREALAVLDVALIAERRERRLRLLLRQRDTAEGRERGKDEGFPAKGRDEPGDRKRPRLN